MIRSRPPLSPERALREKRARVRAEIATLEQPSPLGPRHDAHVRPAWNARIVELRALLVELDSPTPTHEGARHDA